jgi:N-acyl-D-amino-acid deacylase
MDLNGYPINLALLCGYNLIRERLEGPGATTFRGADVYKQYSSAQIAEMEPAIRTAMKDGAFGLSFGFEYCPGCTAEEAVQAASYAKDEGCSLLAAHYRKDADGCVDSVREAVTISRESGIPFQFSHIGSGAAFGDDQIMRKCLRLLEGARQDGVDILADCYPYTAFSALIGTTVFDDGCLERWHASYEALLVADGPCRG